MNGSSKGEKIIKGGVKPPPSTPKPDVKPPPRPTNKK